VGTPVTHLFGVNLQTPDVQLIGNNTDTIYQSHYAKVHILITTISKRTKT